MISDYPMTSKDSMAVKPRTPQSPPLIPPLPINSEEHRPFWSVMIPAYNCSSYLKEAIESVLMQDQGAANMQIEVCDDASEDADVRQIVEDVGQGRVSYFRQPANVGSLRNFETCLNRSRGKLVHLLHGDDKVRRGFYQHMEELFSVYPDMGMAFCRYYSLDQEDGTESLSDLEKTTAGILDNWLGRISSRQLIQVPAVVVPRAVYEHIGSFYGVHYGEDWEMWIRIAAHYPVGYLPYALADYRKHGSSITGNYLLTGQNIRDLKKVMQVSKQYFSKHEWRDIYRKARRFYAQYAMNTARKIWGRYQNGSGTRAQIRESISLHVNGDLLFQAVKLYAKMALHIKR